MRTAQTTTIENALAAQDWPAVLAKSRGRIEADKGDAAAWMLMGVALKNHGQLAQAEYALRRAALIAPGNDEVALNLSATWIAAGRWQEAAELAVAVWNRSRHPWAALNLAAACLRGTVPERALAVVEAALTDAPDMPELSLNLASLLKDLGRHPEAMAALEHVLRLRPSDDTAAFNLALLQLQNGLARAGLANYERRWGSASFRQLGQARTPLPIAPWCGEPLAGRSLLLIAEQGMGDTLQFSRYVHALAKLGPSRMVLVCPAPLVRLLGHSLAGVAEVRPGGPGLAGPIDYYLHLMSVAHVLGESCAWPYARSTYLLPPGPAMTLAPLVAGQRCRIGLCWQGGSTFQHDYKRSLPPGLVAALMAHFPQVSWYSLQKDGQAWAADLGPGLPVLHDRMPEVKDFADTAMLVAGLDLVISVDTAVAHLAAGMGKSTWIVHRFGREWRWLRERSDSPWYPAVSMFEQARAGDWEVVMTQVAQALAAWLEARPCKDRGAVIGVVD